MLTYDSNVHQFTFLNSTEEGEGQRQKESLWKQFTLYWGLTARASLWFASQKVLVLCDDLILTWGTFYTPKRERGRKGMPIMWLSGSFSHQTGCDEYHLWWIVDPNVPLQPLKMNGKKENIFLCAYSWLVWLTWCSCLSLPHRKELNPCQIPGVLLQEMLQDHPCGVARESVRICPSEMRQKKINVILRWRSIYILPISFCISASFNWTHYTESLVFLQKF